VLVVNDLLAHVDRRAEAFQSFLNGHDSPVDTRAVSARGGDHHTLAGGCVQICLRHGCQSRCLGQLHSSAHPPQDARTRWLQRPGHQFASGGIAQQFGGTQQLW